MVKDNITIRPYRPGDEKVINDLFNRIFKKSRTLDEWKWKFIDNPSSKDPALWVTVAENNGKIVGHYASIPIEMKIKDKVALAGQPVDLMIDPSFRSGARIFWELNKENKKNNKGISAFAFGFPNENSYEVGKRFLGYKDLCEMVQLFKRLSYRNAIKRRVKLLPCWILNLIDKLSRLFYRLTFAVKNLNERASVRNVDYFDERIDGLWEKAKDRYAIMTIRNLSYLRWRYKNENYTKIIAERGNELLGYSVIKIEEFKDARVGYLLDILYKDNIKPILSGTLKHLLWMNVDYVLCVIIQGDPMEKYFEQFGFRKHKGFKRFPIVCNPLSPDLDNGFLKKPQNWHLTYGDIDGF